MSEHRCLNCKAPGAEPYDLTVRSNAHEDVYLCATCYAALQEEMADAI